MMTMIYKMTVIKRVETKIITMATTILMIIKPII